MSYKSITRPNFRKKKHTSTMQITKKIIKVLIKNKYYTLKENLKDGF